MTVIEAITQAANEYGIDPKLAIATAQVESGLNPQAIGDGGTSFGLFQLHRGGELGNMSPQQAFDPLTNARRALSEFANVKKNFPNLTDPGRIAALAQRPADPNGYAAKVNAALGSVGNIASGGAAGAATAAQSGISWLASQLGANPSDLFTRGAFIVLGILIVGAGVFITFSGGNASKAMGSKWQSARESSTVSGK